MRKLLLSPIIVLLLILTSCSSQVEMIPLSDYEKVQVLSEQYRVLSEQYYNLSLMNYEASQNNALIASFYINRTRQLESELSMVAARLEQNKAEAVENIVTTEGSTFTVCPKSMKGRCPYWMECTGSMNPTFDCNNTLTFIRSNEARIGNIIAFEVTSEELEDNFDVPEDTKFIIHRIINITPNDKFVTKGDANPYEDPLLVSKDNVMGILVQVDYRKWR